MAKDQLLVPSELKNSFASIEAHHNVERKVCELDETQKQLSEELQLIKNQNETFKALLEEKLGTFTSHFGPPGMQVNDVKENMGQRLESSLQAVTTSKIENESFRIEREVELVAMKARLQALEDAVTKAVEEAAKKIQAELTSLKPQVKTKQTVQYSEFNETERAFIPQDDTEKDQVGRSLEKVQGGWHDDQHQSKKASEQPVAGSALAAARVTRSSSTTALKKSSSTTALAAAHRYRYRYHCCTTALAGTHKYCPH